MNPSSDKTLATFQTNREVRLQEILRVFAALDTGDEPYWWTPDRQGLVQYARQELRDAAPQTEAGQRFPVPQHEDTTHSSGSAVAAMAAAEEITQLRMQLGYIATELMQRGDERTLPEIIENAAASVKDNT